MLPASVNKQEALCNTLFSVDLILYSLSFFYSIEQPLLILYDFFPADSNLSS